MKKMAIINKYGNIQYQWEDHIPRVGDKLGLFHYPHPTVQSVLFIYDKQFIPDGISEDTNIILIVE